MAAAPSRAAARPDVSGSEGTRERILDVALRLFAEHSFAGTSLQMMQQWTGVNFIFYFGTTFFQDLGTISNPFLIGLITTLVNVCSTPISFWAIEKVGRRPLLIWGAVGMFTCEFIVAIVGVTDGQNKNAVSAMNAIPDMHLPR